MIKRRFCLCLVLVFSVAALLLVCLKTTSSQEVAGSISQPAARRAVPGISNNDHTGLSQRVLSSRGKNPGSALKGEFFAELEKLKDYHDEGLHHDKGGVSADFSYLRTDLVAEISPDLFAEGFQFLLNHQVDDREQLIESYLCFFSKKYPLQAIEFAKAELSPGSLGEFITIVSSSHPSIALVEIEGLGNEKLGKSVFWSLAYRSPAEAAAWLNSNNDSHWRQSYINILVKRLKEVGLIDKADQWQLVK